MNAPWSIRLSRDEVARAYDETGSLEEAGQMFGVSGMTILRKMKRWGIPRKPRGGSRGTPSDPMTGRFVRKPR